MRKYFCFLGLALILTSCNLDSLLVNDSDLLSVSGYYNGTKFIKPSLKDKYIYLSDISKSTVTEKDYLVFANEHINYKTYTVNIIKEEIRNNNKYGIVSVNIISNDGINTKYTFTQTWIFENNKWKIITFPKDMYNLRPFYTQSNEDSNDNINNKSINYSRLAQSIIEKDPFNISAYGVIILSTKNIKKRKDIINNISFYTINKSDTEYINISKTISDDKEEYDNLQKEKERMKANAAKDKNNANRVINVLGHRAANAVIGNDALSMVQYREFRQSNGSAGYMDYVRSRANNFEDSEGNRFIISALCDGARSSGTQRLVFANMLGIRPMDFDSASVRNICN